jgi:hypothetical protein
MAEREQEQNFYPIAELSFIGSLIDERVQDFEQLTNDLVRAQAQPSVLDDATVHHLHRVHMESLELASSFENQLTRWTEQKGLTLMARAEVKRLQQQMVRYREGCLHIIAVAEQLHVASPVRKAQRRTTVLPKLIVNQEFMGEFISSPASCFALGLVEEEGRSKPSGFLALRPAQVIPSDISDAGFCFGHSLMGTADFEVIHFAFRFYGFETYSILINPNNPVVRAVLTTMVQNGDYFFFAINAAGTATAFRSELGEENLAGLKTNLPRIQRATTTEAQYRQAVAQFEKNPNPPGIVMSWVCRDNVEYLDLTKQRLELTPKAD